MASSYGRRWPANEVSWEDASQFCLKLNSKVGVKLPQGYKFSLPTEAQWEYACRAGTESAYNNGRDAASGGEPNLKLDQIAWYMDSSLEENDYLSDFRVLNPRGVGRKQPNSWGLYDMHGNVHEWCSDWYGSYDEGDYSEDGSYNEEIIDPLGPSKPKGRVATRVCRGGSFFNDAGCCRSAYRNYLPADERSMFTGFRLAVTFAQ